MKKYTKHTNCRFSPEADKKLNLVSKKTDRPVSYLIRKAVDQYLEKVDMNETNLLTL